MKIYTTPFGVSTDYPVYLHKVVDFERANAIKEQLETGATIEFVIEKFADEHIMKGLVVGFYPGQNESNIDEDMKNTIMKFVTEK